VEAVCPVPRLPPGDLSLSVGCSSEASAHVGRFSRAQVETVNGYSLLVTLPGSTGTMPVMLTGHQDVVVASSALDQWVHPPFEGHFDGVSGPRKSLLTVTGVGMG
jgi:acetylornithine deacetylase/succinyl-diaminopimelate desuccinylase-like protein